MARFFIDRPIFAWVIAIVIMLAGALSIRHLPISRYPVIAPPTISISAFYPGASAQVVEDSVTQIIEQNLKGLDGLLYMSANSQSNGAASITLTFASGTNADIAHLYTGNDLDNVIDARVVEYDVRLDGGRGADTLIGNAYADNTYVIDDVGDVIENENGPNGSPGKDTVETSLSYTLGQGVDNLVLTGTAATRGTGNALGNVLDRLMHGHVVDFIQWHWRDHYWPAFNIADSAIVAGAIGIGMFGLFGGKAGQAAK